MRISIKNYSWSIFLRLISIITPHYSEEIAHNSGFDGFVSELNWPKYKDAYLKEESVKMVIMLNGKKRGLIEVPSNTNQGKLIELINSKNKLSLINTEKFKKIIFVKNKIINFVQ